MQNLEKNNQPITRHGVMAASRRVEQELQSTGIRIETPVDQRCRGVGAVKFLEEEDATIYAYLFEN